MTDKLSDTTPLGKSVEEIEQESGETRQHEQQRQGFNLAGFSLNPEPPTEYEREQSDRMETDNTSLLGKTLLLNGHDGDASRSPDADRDTTDSSEA